jgi:chemotaxis protein histidine kinase CheA
MATRGPDPEMVRARAASEAAEEARRKAAEEAEQLRAEKAAQEAKAKADLEAKAKAEQDAKAKADLEAQAEAARRQFEEDTRRKVEAEIAEKKRAEEEAQRQAAEEAAARQKAIEDARKAIEFIAGNFDHFGKTLMMIGLKDRPGEIRLQGVDSVDDPALHKLAADALAAQPRNLRCRQTDRLTDGTPLYRCLITKRNSKDPLADIPDSDRDDLALVLVRTGLLLASCDAPRSYADAEDDARGSKQYLWSRVNVPEYKRRCTR